MGNTTVYINTEDEKEVHTIFKWEKAKEEADLFGYDLAIKKDIKDNNFRSFITLTERRTNQKHQFVNISMVFGFFEAVRRKRT